MTSPVDPRAADARVAQESARWGLALCAVTGWFFVIAAGFATGPLQALPWLFVQRATPNPLLIAVLAVFAVLGFLASLLPLGARWSREEIAARAAAATIAAGFVVRVLIASPVSYQARTASMILAMTAAVIGTAAGALFLNAVIGMMNRRAVAGGVVAAILVRHLDRLMPGREIFEQWDQWALGWAVLMALAGAFALSRWRAAPAEDRGDSFERRAGGLRLRGALALGALLFFELTYGLPGLASTSPPGEDGARAAAVAAAGLVPLGIAWLFVVRGMPVARHRFLAVALSIVVTGGAIYPFLGTHDFRLVAAAAVLAQCAAFLLFGRALAPASGRRSGRKLATGLALFLLLTIAKAATVVSADTVPFDHGRLAGTVVAVVAGLVLAVAMYLTPRPVPAPQPLSDRWLFAIVAALPVAGLLAALA